MSTEEPDPIDTGKPTPSGKAGDGLRREMATQAARDAGLEVEHLKKLLSAQDAAKVHAQSVAATMQKEMRTLESDNARLRAEIKRLQDQLAFAEQEGRSELRRALDREEATRKELVELRGVATTALDRVSGSKKWLTLSLGLGVPALILAAVIYFHAGGLFSGAGDPSNAQAKDDSPIAEAAIPQAADRSKPAGRDFAAGLGRLDQALDSFKGEKPEEVLQRVHLQNAAKEITVCSFAWNNGDPTLEFGTKEGLDLNASMTRCADAVEKSSK
jgi:DNA-binding transcriptional MerR regulator